MKQLELGTSGSTRGLTIPECYPRTPGESDGATLRRYLRDYPHKGSQSILNLHPPQGDEQGAEWWDD